MPLSASSSVASFQASSAASASPPFVDSAFDFSDFSAFLAFSHTIFCLTKKRMRKRKRTTKLVRGVDEQ